MRETSHKGTGVGWWRGQLRETSGVRDPTLRPKVSLLDESEVRRVGATRDDRYSPKRRDRDPEGLYTSRTRSRSVPLLRTFRPTVDWPKFKTLKMSSTYNRSQIKYLMMSFYNKNWYNTIINLGYVILMTQIVMGIILKVTGDQDTDTTLTPGRRRQGVTRRFRYSQLPSLTRYVPGSCLPLQIYLGPRGSTGQGSWGQWSQSNNGQGKGRPR